MGCPKPKYIQFESSGFTQNSNIQKIKKWTGWTQNRCPEFIKMGVNGTAVAPHGLILGEDEATPSRKVFKYLPGPFWGQKRPQRSRSEKSQKIIKNPFSHPYSWSYSYLARSETLSAARTPPSTRAGGQDDGS